ncbi:MAG: AAA family ATPase, partial [Myxococcales bacterium]
MSVEPPPLPAGALPLSASGTTHPLLGRARETDELARGLEDARGGRGRFLFLVGEPGIGKTRLCDEATA